ncbi:uncharacterized protein LOC119585960 [Penaeus monodon]|uniref:uncharacterized protein LOC119585960 n=1 Tax=Penaeus monodon TaxID=6687 RepID=UPI0018A6EBD0|nr:uncharacterized protein LOC119585960 [Penaeus monodon]
MKEEELLPRETPTKECVLGTRGRPLLLPMLSAFLCLLVLAQAASFFFLFGRVEEVRGRAEAAEATGKSRDAHLSRELEALKEQLRAVRSQYPAHAPPHPPPTSAARSDAHRGSHAHHRPGHTPDGRPSGHRRAKRRASDPSYGVNGEVGEADGESGELSVKPLGEGSDNRSGLDESWLQLTSYSRIPRFHLSATPSEGCQWPVWLGEMSEDCIINSCYVPLKAKEISCAKCIMIFLTPCEWRAEGKNEEIKSEAI